MNEIIFYRDKNGKEPVLDYMKELERNNSKDSNIKLKKIRHYINILTNSGTYAGEPFVKYLIDGIWELRPLRDRILFVSLVGGKYILLHHFVKKTQKTPISEIEKAKRELADYLERNGING